MTRARLAWEGLVVSAVSAALAGPLLGACSHPASPFHPLEAGNPRLGEAAIVHYGCGSCHTIPGVRGADSLMSPPLAHFGKRAFIAGRIGNTEPNLIRWIEDPQAVDPGNVMPNLGVTDTDAANIAAYLERLE
ncbi:MAG TPA: c-type cytochrome [Acidimicrobiales bacterium]